ncbi:Minor extracellular protease vpr, partial [Tolypocladium paradoxum]
MVRSSLLVSLAAAASTALAAEASTNVVPGAFIFELQDGHDPNALYNAVQKEGTTRMRLDYELFKGVSVQLHDVEKADQTAAKIAALPDVKNVWPLRLYDMPNPRVEWTGSNPKEHFGDVERRAAAHDTNDTFSPHVMTQVDKLRAEGYTGSGIRIAVIDSGIDYKHPALGGCFGKGCRVAFGTDLVGDAYNGRNTPLPGPDPMDCGGHGTHVAGIIAAQPNKFGFTGAAPDAVLGAYRVFGCKGQASNDVLIAAYNMAYQDGANIITTSIGGASGWPEDPWAVAVSRIVDKGVPCTMSAGNSGAQGLFYASGAADAKGVTAVASFDNALTPTLLYNAKYAVDGGDDVTFGYVPAEPDAWDGVTLDLYATSQDPTVKDDGCSALPDGTPDLSSKIVLIRRGTCTFAQKATNAAAKGARYVMVYNNIAGALAMDLSAVSGVLAGGMTTPEVGETWVAALKAGKKVTLKMVSRKKTDTQLIAVPNNATGGALSAYTSWGPTWEMDLKPQVGAPGANILSTYPLALGGYAVMSGTSMACPITAGIVALVAEVRGTFDPATIDNLLSSNANPQRFNDGAKFYDVLAPAAQQGGGLVQAHDAAFATTLLEPSGLSFNDTDHLAKSLRFKLSNTGGHETTYKLSHVPAVTMYTLAADSIHAAPFPNERVDGAATLKLSEDSVTIAPGGSATIDVAATAPAGLDAKRLALWSGWVAVNGSDGTSLSIPYQGLTGSLHDSQVLGANDSWIALSTDGALRPAPTNKTFTIPAPGKATGSTELPALVVSLALGSPLIRADIVPMTTCPPKNLTTELWGVKTIGQPYGFPARYRARGRGLYPWDGRLDSGNYAPPG